MATAPEKLASSLEALKALQDEGRTAIKSAMLTRTHRERLLKNGFLREVIKGWYIPSRPDETPGESTSWYASFWTFCSEYLAERFGEEWSLSPEQSLLLHAGNRNVPEQLVVRAPKARNQTTALIHETAILEVRATLPEKGETSEVDGLRLFTLEKALISASQSIFQTHSTDIRAALALVRDASDILPGLLDGGHPVVAGRLAGAFRNIGKTRIADDIVKAMTAAGHTVRETDPFGAPSPLIMTERVTSPYVARVKLMWSDMAPTIHETFPDAPGKPNDIDAYIERIEEIYVTDAYHSLSIEGYRVTPELIDRVRSGNWNPDTIKDDQDHLAALAARGYYQAFQSVKKSIRAILEGENAGEVLDRDHGDWYLELFGPSVQAGILKQSDLAGYRSGPVYIRKSKHTPPSRDAVRDLMPCFFELLTAEEDPKVRAILGHFVFVYIHPYTDGNGRMGRFIMNAMLASGGYPWTVIPVESRNDYMAALESASVKQDIRPFVDFVSKKIN